MKPVSSQQRIRPSLVQAQLLNGSSGSACAADGDAVGGGEADAQGSSAAIRLNSLPRAVRGAIRSNKEKGSASEFAQTM